MIPSFDREYNIQSNKKKEKGEKIERKESE